MTVSFFIVHVFAPLAQTDQWTPQQMASADLARNLAGWSSVEKDVVLHTNLVRMYPLKYLKVEVKPWDTPINMLHLTNPMSTIKAFCET